MDKKSNYSEESNSLYEMLEGICDLFNISFEDILKDVYNTTAEKKRTLPSERDIPFDKKEYYYKLVQEYIDKEVKPYNSNTEEVNNEFAKIFEFVCWLSNK